MEIMKFLIGIGANVNISVKDGVTPLFGAIHGNRTDIVEFLITLGANVNTVSEHQEPLFFAAVEKGIIWSIHLLRANDFNGTISFNLDNQNIFDLLIKNGADINVTRMRDSSGRNALHIAAEKGKISFIITVEFRIPF